MNFNELQEAWKEEGRNEGPMKIPSEGVYRASQPIDAIRKNMKKEYYAQLFFILILFFFPIFFNISGSILIVFFSVFGFLLIITAYYFFRFYILFKKMHNYDTSTRDNLYELYFEIRLHIEMYRSFSFLLLPFVFVVLGILEYHNHLKGLSGEELIHYFERAWLRIPIMVIGFTLLIVGMTQWWTERFYGKHAKRIKLLIDEIKE